MVNKRITLNNLPDWRNTLVTSAAEAELLFRQTMRAAGLNDALVSVSTKRGLSLFGQLKEGEPTKGLVDADILGGKYGIYWHNIAIHKDYRGNKLALIAVKCALGFAHECQQSMIDIYCVRDEGVGFWPSIGATPKNGCDDVAVGIRGVLDHWGHELTNPQIMRLEKIAALSLHNSRAAWRRASQLPGKVFSDGYSLQEKIFAPVCEELDLRLNLNDPATKAILRRRLGVIPTFKETAIRYRRMAAQ